MIVSHIPQAGPDLDWMGWFVIATLSVGFIIMALDKVSKQGHCRYRSSKCTSKAGACNQGLSPVPTQGPLYNWPADV